MNIPEIISKLKSAIDLDEDLVTGRVYGARLNSERAAAILAEEMPRAIDREVLVNVIDKARLEWWTLPHSYPVISLEQHQADRVIEFLKTPPSPPKEEAK